MALEDLFPIKDNETAMVASIETGIIDIADYAFVYFKSWEALRDMASAAAIYFGCKGVPFADEQVRHITIEKSVQYMAMWKENVRVPETIWGLESVGICSTKYKQTHYPSLNLSMVKRQRQFPC